MADELSNTECYGAVQKYVLLYGAIPEVVKKKLFPVE